MEDRSAPMLLRLLTPAGTAAEVGCDSVQLTLRDNADGAGGGLVGIRRNHAPAVLALSEGPVRAFLRGETVLRATAGGFASVRDNVITVISDSAEVEGRTERGGDPAAPRSGDKA